MNAEHWAQQDTGHWPEPIEVLNPGGRSPVLLLCEHASNHLPAEYRELGLPADELTGPLAWDPGAAEVTRLLARALDATAFLATYSRLLIDLNRPLASPHSIVACARATDIPGNRRVSQAERERRAKLVFAPFHARVAAEIEQRRGSGGECVMIAIHSFTPTYLGQTRPWHAGVLFDRATQLGSSILAQLRRDPALDVAPNAPYALSAEDDYSLPTHGDACGNPALQIEIRQDLLADRGGAQAWADRIAAALRDGLSTSDEVAQRRMLRARGFK